MKPNFSEAERALIFELSPRWAKALASFDDFNPPKILELVALECFMNNKTGSAVDALRRAIKALSECKIYRMTPEFDALCKWD